mgnify:CR=1 FL=1
MDIIKTIAQELDKDPRHVENVVRLLDEGNTVPFIARYRKELHGAMDDTALRTLCERLGYLRSLEERRETVKKAIGEQGKLTARMSASSESISAMMSLAPWRASARVSTPFSGSMKASAAASGAGQARSWAFCAGRR